MQFIRIALIAVLLNGCGDLITTSDGAARQPKRPTFARCRSIRTKPPA